MSFSIALNRQSKTRLKRITRAGLGKELFDEIIKLWDKEAQKIASHISKTKLTGQRKKVRSGALRRNIVGQAMRFRGVPALRVGVLRGPALSYAGLQEFGTQKWNKQSPYPTIRPKKTKYLAYPPDGSPALYPSGVNRYPSARHYPGKLVFIPFKGKNAVGGLYDAAELAGADSLRELQVVYVLLRRMDIKPGFFLRDGMTERLPILLIETTKLIDSFFTRSFSGKK